MSNQYFENNENLRSEPYEIAFYFRKKLLKFKSDNGVFSKHNVDFGSSLLLQNITYKQGDCILDVGCGVGIIGLTLAKMDDSLSLTLIDVNRRALELAKYNQTLNDLNNVTIFESNVYSNVKECYDVIVTNPPIRAGKKIVHAILLGAFEHLHKDGMLYAVIQKKQGAESAIKALNTVFELVEIIQKDNGYWIIKATK